MVLGPSVSVLYVRERLRSESQHPGHRVCLGWDWRPVSWKRGHVTVGFLAVVKYVLKYAGGTVIHDY